MQIIKTKCPAKINLYLKVGNLRKDGLHNIRSRFQLVDLYDDLMIKKTNCDFLIKSNLNKKKFLQNNILNLAHYHLTQETGENLRCEVYLKKNIPIGAGLGGGSSNAASFLVATNKLFKLGLSLGKLNKIAAKIGADIPFFMHGKNAYVYGFGNHLAKSKNYNHRLLIIYPNLYLSTAMMFNEFDKANINKRNLKNDFMYIFEKNYSEVYSFFNNANDKYGLEFLMSGTGSCFFTPWVRNESTKLFLEKIPKKWRFFLVEPLQYSPILNI